MEHTERHGVKVARTERHFLARFSSQKSRKVFTSGENFDILLDFYAKSTLILGFVSPSSYV